MLCMLRLQGVKQQAGMAGLQNLGNSCYMNAAVQCLSHTMPLRTLLLDAAYKEAINKENILGSKGVVVTAFGDVVQALWQVNMRACSVQCHC